MLTDDDEVAVTFLPDTYELVAYPLVQVREVARLAVGRHPAARSVALQFVESVRALPFQERTVYAVRRASGPLQQMGFAWCELESWLTHQDFNLKRQDAIAVVEAVREAGRLQLPGE